MLKPLRVHYFRKAGDEHRAVLRPQMSGGWIELEQHPDPVDHFNRTTALTNPNPQREPALLIDHVGELECPTIGCSNWKLIA